MVRDPPLWLQARRVTEAFAVKQRKASLFNADAVRAFASW